MSKLKPYRKAIVAFLISVVGGAVAQGVISGDAAVWATVVIGALTTAGVYATPNTSSD